MFANHRDSEFKPSNKQTMKGGTKDFNWEDVRYMNYKDRECYLGYTVKIGFLDKGGKWKKKDWWTQNNNKEKTEEEVERERMRQEIMVAKAEDEKRMRIALGQEKPEEEFALPMLNGDEAREITKKMKQEAQEEDTADYYEKMGGIGFNSLAHEVKEKSKKSGKPSKQEMQNHYKQEGYGDQAQERSDTGMSEFDLKSFLTRNKIGLGVSQQGVNEKSKKVKKEKKDKKDKKHKKDRKDKKKDIREKEKKHKRDRD